MKRSWQNIFFCLVMSLLFQVTLLGQELDFLEELKNYVVVIKATQIGRDGEEEAESGYGFIVGERGPFWYIEWSPLKVAPSETLGESILGQWNLFEHQLIRHPSSKAIPKKYTGEDWERSEITFHQDGSITWKTISSKYSWMNDVCPSEEWEKCTWKETKEGLTFFLHSKTGNIIPLPLKLVRYQRDQMELQIKISEIEAFYHYQRK